MFRTFRFVIGVVLVLALFAATTLSTSAAAPQAHRRLAAPNVPSSPFAVTAPDGSGDRAQRHANLKADLAALERQSSIRPRSGRVPSAVRAATALQRSLSAAQKRQLNAIVSKYTQRLTGISARFEATPSGAARGKAPQNVRGQADALATLNARMTRGVNRILTRSQRANHGAATRPVLSQAQAAVAAATSSRQAIAAPGQPQTLGSYCYYGAYYEALATWYKYYAYVYAYYNYINNPGDTNAYNIYLYTYYADHYGDLASSILPQVYFDYLTTGRDWRGIGDDGVRYAYYDYVYEYYAYVYAYYSYRDNVSTDNYYLYLYTYYGQYYGYYGYYYSNNYCQ